MIAIRDTAKAATGKDLSFRTDRVTVVPASPWGTLLVIVPLLVVAVFLASMMLYHASGRQSSPVTVPARAAPRMVFPHRDPWYFERLQKETQDGFPKKE